MSQRRGRGSAGSGFTGGVSERRAAEEAIAHGGSASASVASSSTLRPRARRLISIESNSENADAIYTDGAASSSSVAASSSLRDVVDAAFSSSRRQSPAPSAHPSRGSSLTRASGSSIHGSTDVVGRGSRSYGLELPPAGVSNISSRRGKASSSLWSSSWTSLQGVASTLLGSNITEPDSPQSPTAGGRTSGRKPRPGHKYGISVSEEPWGPPGRGSPADLLAAGSRQERLDKVQAEKRKRLLVGASYEAKVDASGKYKRRSSLDQPDNGLHSPTLEDKALVYIHLVQPSDSIAGLSIRYNCSQATVRKANRLYPNDTIQARKIAFLPVDACSIRGRKVPAPGSSNLELLAGTENTTATKKTNDTPKLPQASPDYHIASPPLAPRPDSESATDIENAERPWTHDSWVILPHSSDPTEIGRLPRQTLGFFPPARRKSVTMPYRDVSPSRSITSDQAPSNAASSLTTSTLTSSPIRGISPGRMPMGRPSRSSSTASKLNPHARLAASFLNGPGGIGSLHSSFHGAPPDELNKFAALHLPYLIIDGVENANGANGVAGHARTLLPAPGLGIGAVGPRLSFDRTSVASGGSAGTSVEAVAGAVEGWMRKVGGRVKGSLGTPEMRGRGGTRDGDLIELVDSWDLNGGGGSDSWESQGHGVMTDGTGGVDGTGAAAAGSHSKGKTKEAAATLGATSISAANASARDNEEQLLRERFPPAGRVFEERSKKSS